MKCATGKKGAGNPAIIAAGAGFDWPSVDGLFDKLREETDELREHLKDFPAPGPRPQHRGVAGSGRTVVPEQLQFRLEEEVGDLLFVLVNIARYLSIDAESALRKTNRKFRRRFQYLEEKLRQQGSNPSAASLDEMDELWNQAKREKG